MLGIRGVRRGIIYMTASAMARTVIDVTELVSHPEMSPLNEVARTKHVLQQHTVHERTGARAEGACEHVLRLPPHLSNRSPSPPVNANGGI